MRLVSLPFLHLTLVCASYIVKIEWVQVFVHHKQGNLTLQHEFQDEEESWPLEFNSTFAEDMVAKHNEKRKLHGAQMLTWNKTVFEYAAEYASKYDCSGQLKHLGGSYGENLAIGYTLNGTIDAWYDEGKSYQYGTESTYNHFTALIWNSTCNVGCAYKYCNEVWHTYIICSYYPAGNVVGQSKENVLPTIN